MNDEHGQPSIIHSVDPDRNLWIRLTVCGVTRLGVGDGPSMKERVGDAIRNAAMRFGVALDLWSKEELESGLAAEEDYQKRAEEPAHQVAKAPKTDWEMARQRAWDATAFRATSPESRRKLWDEFHAVTPDPKVDDFDKQAELWRAAAPRPAQQES